jgi:Na+-driven multidrug efflux pump
MDKAFNRISLAGGLLCVALALFLAPAFGSLGTAWSAVAAQTFVTGCMFVMLLSFKRNEQRKTAPEIVHS